MNAKKAIKDFLTYNLDKRCFLSENKTHILFQWFPDITENEKIIGKTECIRAILNKESGDCNCWIYYIDKIKIRDCDRIIYNSNLYKKTESNSWSKFWIEYKTRLSKDFRVNSRNLDYILNELRLILL